jgi:hypothetical protein
MLRLRLRLWLVLVLLVLLVLLTMLLLLLLLMLLLLLLIMLLLLMLLLMMMMLLLWSASRDGWRAMFSICPHRRPIRISRAEHAVRSVIKWSAVLAQPEIHRHDSCHVHKLVELELLVPVRRIVPDNGKNQRLDELE